MTGADHEHSEIVVLAAQWYSEQKQPPQPVVPELRKRFPLSAREACEALALANRYRILRRAHG
ncbi:hypothetical protein [Rhizobium hidalgonense]|uniref:DUF982 domain-containing protein n=1 Tax=Rhizobium hidalgonense TaxID=1538159 RepID=A0ABX4JXZ6_9HYPH|nr:hypothetical protein [Rhizobium hidalgonense]PDT24451.1 hypothetical protein CO674_07140 [Rhizobium hidalgonense]PON04842.1 hypothetical protein ATY29_25630 [Rhizobium hidalgonense]